jgi:mono/diheme cytochrome c family protein
MACGNCHTPKDADGMPIESKDLSGGLTFNTPSFAGTASNITPDRETGIGGWSDSDIKRAIMEGARPASARLPGVPLSDVMPFHFYKALVPEDADAIVAYLRTVPPVHNAVVGPNYKGPAGTDLYPDAEAGFTAASLSDPVRHGAYLATLGHCMGCHSTRARGVSDYKNGFGKGGRPFTPAVTTGYPSTWQGSVASNITSHARAGIGAWTDVEIKRAMTHGVARDGRPLKTPMIDHAPYFRLMTETDLDAIVAWLRTVPPLE